MTPTGDLVADPARGLFTGNRGGRIHDPVTRTLTGRRHASRRWICCALAFRERRRTVWGEGYTDLFFLDEVTALAAGHRPCFQCRRADATAFRDALARAGASFSSADALDRALHAERTARPRPHLPVAGLPDGTVLLLDGRPHAVRDDCLLSWAPTGWGSPRELPGGQAEIVTPRLVRLALAAGYAPRWHETAASG